MCRNGQIELTSAAEVTINSQLAIGDLSPETTVNANAAIDATTSTVNGLVPEQSLAELPLDNLDLFSAVTLEPGVAPNPSSAPSLLSSGKSGQVAISGVRPSMTNLLIDGMDATDPVWGYSPAGASGFFLGLNELAEVNVLTQTFNAEYSGHGGAVTDMVTKPITCSTIRILAYRAILKARFSWEGPGTPSSRTPRVITPRTPAKS